MIKVKFQSMNVAIIRKVTTLGLLVVMTVGSTSALAQIAANDPSLEVFRIRCQIDADINAATGLLEPKVQIQAKARAELLDGQEVSIRVENVSRTIAPTPPAAVYVNFELGSATADWDTFPDPLDPAPVTWVAGDFVESNPDPVTGEPVGDTIKVTAQVTLTGQTVTGTGQCA